MRVTVINPNFARSSGVTTAIRRISSEMGKLGIEQDFIDCGFGDDEEDTQWIASGNLRRLSLMSANPWTVASALIELRRHLRQKRIAVVHVHHRRLALLLAPLQRLFGFKLLYTAQLSYPFAWWFYWTAPAAAVPNSHSVARNVSRTMFLAPSPVIGNPSDFPSKLPEFKTEDLPLRVICVARIEPVKGHIHLLQAWRLVSDKYPSAELWIVGEGSLRSQLEEEAAKLNLSSVRFLGFRSDVGELTRQCRFAVLASEVEGHPVAVVESASQGRATLVTDVDGSRDCVPPGSELPNTVPYGDSSALADALCFWLQSPALVGKEGQRFFEFHREGNSSEVISMQYAQLYRSMIDA